MEKEFKLQQMHFDGEYEIKIFYKGEYIALRRVDFLVADTITVEIKARAELDDVQWAQSINYLESSSYPIGLLINFGTKSLQFKRLYNKKFPLNQNKSYES